MTTIRVLKGQSPQPLQRAEFRERYVRRFVDPAFDGEREAIERLVDIAYDAYVEGRKAPHTRPAGEGHADPAYETSQEWLATRDRLVAAQRAWEDPATQGRVLLVCADGGNPDVTSTHGKRPEEAKRIEADGWHCPKHLAGRAYGLIVHGDVAGVESQRRNLSDWLGWMGLVDAGPAALLDRYVGYWQPYCDSHDALDADTAVQDEARNVASAVVAAVRALRDGTLKAPDAAVRPSRVK